jgi:hypothetical protein
MTMDKKSKIWAGICVTAFLTYLVLSTFNLLYSNYYYQKNEIVGLIGGLTDIGQFDFIWTPGWILGYVAGAIIGDKATFVTQFIVFVIGTQVILMLFNYSLGQLSNDFDQLIRKDSGKTTI